MPRSRLLACLLFAIAPRLASAQTALNDAVTRNVDKVFDNWRGTESPGCAVGASRRGEIVLQRGYGMANLETGTPIGPSTVFHSASIAKQVTSLAVMLLASERRLSLDDDVRKWVPELPAYGVTVTLRQMLTHTSGLRDYVEMLTLARGRFEEDRITEADMLDIVSRQRSLNNAPGTEFLYTNTGYALAALVVKRASGKSLREYAAERIFTPLAMSSTSFRDDYTTIVPGRASGYARRGTGWRTSTPNYDVYGATGLLTTVSDLLLWEENVANPRVGDASMFRQMTTSAVLANGDSTGYGLGVSLAIDRGARVVEHEGSDPGFRAYLGRYSADGVAVAVLCNTNSANAVALGRAVADVYRGPQPAAPAYVPARQPETSVRVSAASRAGVYFQPTRREVVELSWRDGDLYTARRGGAKLLQLDDSTFAVAGRPVEHVFTGVTQSGYIARSVVPGSHPVVFEWKAPFRLKPGALSAYAGEYVSEELNAVYKVSVQDSTIVLQTGTSSGLVARPVFAETFVSGQYTIEFESEGKRVSGFYISHPRARRLAFRKTPSGERR